MRRALSRLLSAAVLAAAVLVLGCGRRPALPEREAPRVSVLAPEKRALTDFAEYNGWLQPDATVDVRSRVRGEIFKVSFKDGQIVEEDRVLFELDPRPFEADLGEVKDQLKIYEAQKVASEKELARLKELLGKGGASQRQVDKATADVDSLAAQISATNNAIARAQLNLDYSRIQAPITGRVGRALLTEGNYVNAGGTDPVLTTIVSVTPIRVYFNVDERSLRKVVQREESRGETLTHLLTGLRDVRAPFTFSLDGETTFDHQGELVFGNNEIDVSTGTIQLYGLVENKDGTYVPGTRTRVRLPLGKPYDALLVPDTAVLSDQDRRYVLVLNAKNIAERRNVVLGALTDDGMRAILPAARLPEGEDVAGWRVIVDNLQRVRVNYPAVPVDDTASPAVKE